MSVLRQTDSCGLRDTWVSRRPRETLSVSCARIDLPYPSHIFLAGPVGMFLTRRVFGPFVGTIAKKLDHYSQFQPSSLSIQQYLDFGRYGIVQNYGRNRQITVGIIDCAERAQRRRRMNSCGKSCSCVSPI